MLDLLQRPLKSLRISVTDRCNLRCAYCMPEQDYVWLPRSRILTYEETARLVRIFQRVGVDRVRLTGGEPLLRRDLARLVEMLAGLGLQDLALTTNGALLAERAAELRAAGLQRLTVSLDTLHQDRFEKLTRRDKLGAVLQGVRTAKEVGFHPLKLDTVVLRGRNHDELKDLLAFARDLGAEIRFIEYMDVGGATDWSPESVFSRQEMLARIEQDFGPVEPLAGRGSAPAERFRLEDGTVFGIIASTTQPFCRDCDRARLTADGRLFTCLYALNGLDLRGPLREGETSEQVEQRIRNCWTARSDRGAEERQGLTRRGSFLPVEKLRRDPHLEMHTRGG